MEQFTDYLFDSKAQVPKRKFSYAGLLEAFEAEGLKFVIRLNSLHNRDTLIPAR